jgi:hypothetical protein
MTNKHSAPALLALQQQPCIARCHRLARSTPKSSGGTFSRTLTDRLISLLCTAQCVEQPQKVPAATLVLQAGLQWSQQGHHPPCKTGTTTNKHGASALLPLQQQPRIARCHRLAAQHTRIQRRYIFVE